MTIKETRHISGTDVRAACIRNNWYTRGTGDQYRNMLYIMVDELNGLDTPDFLIGLADVALDIYRHSDMSPEQYGCTEDEVIANILFVLTNDCTRITYEFAR